MGKDPQWLGAEQSDNSYVPGGRGLSRGLSERYKARLCAGAIGLRVTIHELSYPRAGDPRFAVDERRARLVCCRLFAAGSLVWAESEYRCTGALPLGRARALVQPARGEGRDREIREEVCPPTSPSLLPAAVSCARTSVQHQCFAACLVLPAP